MGIGTLLEKTFLTILRMSLLSCYIVVIVCAIRFLLRKLPKLFSYLLWIIVFFRLICPFSIYSPVSIVPESFPAIYNSSDAYSAAGNQAEIGTSGENVTTHRPGVTAAGIMNGEPVNYAGKEIGLVLSGLWLLVMPLLIGRQYYAYRKLSKKLYASVRLTDNIYETGENTTPFVFGILTPRIYLPAGLTEEEQSYIVCHERIHITRRDYIVRTAAYLIACIHWFNPFVWLAYSLMIKDMEMSCDESAIRRLGAQAKKGYSNALLSFALAGTAGSRPLAFGEKDVKGRIRNVLSCRKTKLWTSFLLVLLCLLFAWGLLTTRKPDPARLLIEQWASAFCVRDGNPLYEMSADKEEWGEWPEQDGVRPFGFSSPWPWEDDARITYHGKKAEITYYAWTSDPTITIWKQEVEAVKENGELLIRQNAFRSYDKIADSTAFDQAYGYQNGYDFYEKGMIKLAAAKKNQIESGEEFAVDNMLYLSPDTSAAAILHLTGGGAVISRMDEEERHCEVVYTFADGSSVTIPMAAAVSVHVPSPEPDQNITDPDANWIWVPGYLGGK